MCVYVCPSPFDILWELGAWLAVILHLISADWPSLSAAGTAAPADLPSSSRSAVELELSSLRCFDPPSIRDVYSIEVAVVVELFLVTTTTALTLLLLLLRPSRDELAGLWLCSCWGVFCNGSLCESDFFFFVDRHLFSLVTEIFSSKETVVVVVASTPGDVQIANEELAIIIVDGGKRVSEPHYFHYQNYYYFCYYYCNNFDYYKLWSWLRVL